MKTKIFIFAAALSIFSLFFIFEQKTSAVVYLGCAVRPADNDCSWVPQDKSLLLCESSKWCMANPFVGDTMVYSGPAASCDTGARQCRENNCAGITANNGDPCGTAVGKGGILGGCDTNPRDTGVWDASQNKCILCSSKKENKVCGDSLGVYSSAGGCGGGDGKFESACGASAECDEKNEGEACSPPVGGTCDANGACVAAAACDTKPTVTITPATQSAVAGTPLTYTIDIRNNDDASCPTASRTFNLSSTVPDGWVAGSFASASLAAAKGGGTNSTAYTLTSPVAAAEGNYNFTVTGADAQGSATANGVYTVNTCSASTFTEFGTDMYKIGSMLNIDYAIGAAEPTGDFVSCVYNTSPSEVWNKNIAHFVGSADFGSGVSTVAGSTLGIWTVTLKGGLSCSPAPSGCMGSTEVVECLRGADCPSLVCDFGTHRCTAGPGPGATCAAGDGCLAGCVPPDPDCAAGGTTVGFSSNCYQLIGPAIAATANYTGAAIGPNDTIILYKPDNSISSCMQVTGASGTSNYNLNANGIWTVKIHSGSDCATPGAVKATATTTVQNTPCGGPACAALSAACASDSDCCSGVCDKGNTNTCIEPRCNPLDPFYCNPIPPVNTLTQAGETLIAYILGLIGSIALLFIIIAGLMYMTSAGSEERIANSKRILTGAVIGLGIALLAYSLLQVIITILNL